MTYSKPVWCAAILALGVSTAALAKPPLREVAEINDPLMTIAIANVIRRECDDISGRLTKGIGILRSLKARANELGYSDDEINDFVNSKEEEKIMRARAEHYLESRGVDHDSDEALCAFGRAERARGGAIGGLLR